VDNSAKKPVKVRLYRFKNKLLDKTAGLGKADRVEITIDPEAMARAEEALQAMSEDYPDWVSKLIDKLYDQHRRAVENPIERKPRFDEISKIAHDMKGQGGTFGYPLMTDFAESLYGFTNHRKNIEDSHVEVVKAHIDSMRVIIISRLSGDGGENGQLLKSGLQQAIKKHMG
jgi:chemotaxis protein histidine kinase CheA